MKRLGKLWIMTDHEHFCLTTQLEMFKGYRDVAIADLHVAEAARDDAVAHAADTAKELSRIEEKRRAERKRSFEAGKFHAAGGYSHTLPAVKEQLAHATESLAHCIDLLVTWCPLVASLETTPGQFVDRQFDTKVSVTRELCGIGKVSSDMSDLFARADFAAVGSQVKQERKWKRPDLTREGFEVEYQGHFAGVEK